jgi:hypothetical protein
MPLFCQDKRCRFHRRATGATNRLFQKGENKKKKEYEKNSIDHIAQLKCLFWAIAGSETTIIGCRKTGAVKTNAVFDEDRL